MAIAVEVEHGREKAIHRRRAVLQGISSLTGFGNLNLEQECIRGRLAKDMICQVEVPFKSLHLKTRVAEESLIDQMKEHARSYQTDAVESYFFPT